MNELGPPAHLMAMGSHSFEKPTYTDATYEDAYTDLVRDARYLHGHDGYSGTIATTAGVVLRSSTPMTMAEAAAFGAKDLGNAQKWGPAFAVPLCAETDPVYDNDAVERTGEIRLTAKQVAEVVEAHDGWALAQSPLIRAAIAKSLGVKDGEFTYLYVMVASSEAKTVTAATEGKAVTRYFILISGGVRMPAWEDGYASQAEARKAIADQQFRPFGGSDFDVIGITRRESGDPVVRGTKTAKSAVLTYKVRTRKQIKAGTVDKSKRAGWYFYGWAAS